MAPLVPILAFVLLLLGGLVVDASRVLNARGQALAIAEEAARAGAASIDERETFVRLDEPAAVARAAEFCARVSATNAAVSECEPLGIEAVSAEDPRRIVVRVRSELTIQASLLGLIGVRDLTATAEARARPFEGTSAADIDSDEPPVEVPIGQPPEDEPPVSGPEGPPQGPVPICSAERPTVIPPYCVPRPQAQICPRDGDDPAPPFCLPRDQVQICAEDGSRPDPETPCIPRGEALVCDPEGGPPESGEACLPPDQAVPPGEPAPPAPPGGPPPEGAPVPPDG